MMLFFFFSSRRRHTRFKCDWSSDVCSSDLGADGHGCAVPLHSLPIEFYWCASSVDLERAVGAYRVGANENPVLPRGETAEDAGFQRFVSAEAEIGFEAGEGVGRLCGAGLDGLAEFVFPV